MAVWPDGTLTRPQISSPFGPRKVTQAGASSNHLGTDFILFTFVCAVMAGTVIRVGWYAGWSGGGYMVWVDHGNGVVSRYLHLRDGSALVRIGDRVSEGQRLGVMGTTASPYPVGRHLHLELVVNGVQIDPVPWLTANMAAPAGGGSNPYQEDEMSAAAEQMIAELYQELLPGKAGVKSAGSQSSLLVRAVNAAEATRTSVDRMPQPTSSGGMRILFNKDAPDSEDATRRAIVGELSFQVITGPQSTRERKFWGAPVNVTVGEWNAARDLVNARRAALGLTSG